MKKVVSLLMSLMLMFLLTVSAFATNNMSTSAEMLELTDEILLAMTIQDHQNCYEYLLQYKTENPSCTNEELDAIATFFYVETYSSKSTSASPNSWYDDLLTDYAGLNEDELALAKEYPSDVAAVFSSAGIANNEATSRYSQGAYLGNQDAFRHAAWNALLICRFYALQKGDYDWCLVRTREWTTAHETGEDADPNLSAVQQEADHEMDILNNAVGRAAAEYTFTSEVAALRQVQYYVDNGYCHRIKTDEQMTYSYAQMIAIPNWTLRPTNTVGKN